MLVRVVQIKGLAAATYTPFKEDGKTLNLDVVAIDAASLHKHGVYYAFVNGTSGESMSLSVDERKATTERWVEEGKKLDPPVQVIAHIGANSLSDVCELARHAEAIGCAAISAMPPTLFKPADARALAGFLKEVCAAAPRTPFYYYNFPAITGSCVTVDISPLELLKAVEAAEIRTFRGFKFTDFNLHLYGLCRARHGGLYDCAYGRDEAMLGGLATGAVSSIGNGFCYMANVYHRLREAFFSGDLKTALMEQDRANEVVNLIFSPRFGGNAVATSKAIHEMRGVPVGPPRNPIRPLTEEQRETLKAELTAMGFFDWAD